MFKKYFTFQMALSYIFQAVFSALVPPALLFFFARYLNNKYEIGSWIVIVALVLGIIIGMYSMFVFIIKVSKTIEKQNKEKEGSKDDGEKKQ